MSSIRCFIALPSSQEVRDRLKEIQQQLIQTHADVKWDSAEKFHITLKFLGNVEEPAINTLIDRLKPCAQSTPRFEITYDTLGAFPSVERPRVVWIGSASNPVFTQLQTEVERSSSELGFPTEDRAFHAHITLGRVRGSRNIHRLTEQLKSITFDPIHARCSEVLLIKSDLRPTGSVYTVIQSFPLLS